MASRLLASFTMLATIGCGDDGATTDANVTIVDHISLRGLCTEPIANEVGIVFPDTAVAVQSTLKDLYLVNDGPVLYYDSSAVRFQLEGPDAAEFSIRSDTQPGTDCQFHGFNGSPWNVGRECTIELTFSPHSLGPKQAVLHLAPTGSGRDVTIDQTFVIHATAVPAPTTMYASTPEIYTVAFRGTSFLITNPTTTTVDMGDPIAPAPFQFSQWNCPPGLTPGGACTVSVGVDMPLEGCPSGNFTTTTSALQVPLRTRGKPTPPPTLTVQAGRYGSVSINPGGTSCTDICSTPLTADVTLTATPEPGGHFLGWFTAPYTLHDCGLNPTCVIPAGNTSVQLSAWFASASSVAVAITIAGTGSVVAPTRTCTTSCTDYVDPGTPVMLSVGSGSLVGWSGDCGGTATTCNLGTVINNRAVTAQFNP